MPWAHLAEFNLHCAEQNYDTAASLLNEIDSDYSLLGNFQRIIELHEHLQGKISDPWLSGIAAGIVCKAHVLAEQGEFDQAVELYHKGIAIADKIENIQYQIEALLGLASVYLYTGNLEAARLNAELAHNYNYQKNNHNALTLLGVIALLQGDKTYSKEAFESAILTSNLLLSHSNKNYNALDARGLALCGLALCEENTNYIPDAISAYNAARSITRGTGIVGRNMRLFDKLANADTNGLLVEVGRAVKKLE